MRVEEFIERYGSTTERRIELRERFCEWLNEARGTGALKRLWAFGSFPSDKPGPGDLDILALFSAGFDVAALPPERRRWFDHELCRELLGIDLFYVTEAMPAPALHMVVETFRRDRSGAERLIEIEL